MSQQVHAEEQLEHCAGVGEREDGGDSGGVGGVMDAVIIGPQVEMKYAME